MQAVVVTFYFEAPQEPSARVIEAHQTLLARLPGLRASLALRRSGEFVFVLAFEQSNTIDDYLERAEVRDFGRQPGCYDVYVNRLDVLEVGGDIPLLLGEAAAAVEAHA